MAFATLSSKVYPYRTDGHHQRLRQLPNVNAGRCRHHRRPLLPVRAKRARLSPAAAGPAPAGVRHEYRHISFLEIVPGCPTGDVEPIA